MGEEDANRIKYPSDNYVLGFWDAAAFRNSDAQAPLWETTLDIVCAAYSGCKATPHSQSKCGTMPLTLSQPDHSGDTAGKVRKRKLVGRSEKRAVYWHYGVEMRPTLGRFPHFSLRAHVVFTEDGRRLIASKERMHSLRRSFCRSWWNDRWRDLLQAFTNWLSSGDETVALPTGGEGLSILLGTKPSSMISPFSLVEHAVEELPDDVAAAMDWDSGEDDIDLGEVDLADEAST